MVGTARSLALRPLARSGTLKTPCTLNQPTLPKMRHVDAKHRVMAVQKLAALPNLGPKSAQALAEAGICSLVDIRRLGAVASYAQVKQHQPKTSLNLLWALDGALSGLPWQVVAREHRTSLLLALERLQRDELCSQRPARPAKTQPKP